MGCEYACLYCYVRTNRVISKRSGAWGTYVDVRINAPRLLEKEILLESGTNELELLVKVAKANEATYVEMEVPEELNPVRIKLPETKIEGFLMPMK